MAEFLGPLENARSRSPGPPGLVLVLLVGTIGAPGSAQDRTTTAPETLAFTDITDASGTGGPGWFGGHGVEFADAEFAAAGRDAVYYVRAIEAPDLLIRGTNPLGCELDEAGRCIDIEPCGRDTPYEDDCLSEAEPRAWSSPIFVNHAGS